MTDNHAKEKSGVYAMSLTYVQFQQVDIGDPFFDSLKADYSEFETWFSKKATNMAYLSVNDQGKIDGFLYLKREEGELLDIIPSLGAKVRLKVGTFKVDAHGTKLGDRFIKKLFDHAMAQKVEEVYVTIFEKHTGLIKLLEKYGFAQTGTKTTHNGTELVLVRSMVWQGTGLIENYPLVRLQHGNKYLLALYPEFHTKLLPDSKLINEGPDVISDVSHTNSIQKIYLAGRSGAENLKNGDSLVIYRTSDGKGPAYFRSVATSVCVVEKVEIINAYRTEADFLAYCMPFSVFTETELKQLYKSKKYPVIITFTYNISFPKRITRKALIEEVGLDANARWTCMKLTDAQFLSIIKKGSVDAHFVIH